MSLPVYPYLPPGRTIKYVPHDHSHMQAAAQARTELAGDPLYPVGMVLVRDGQVIARAGNGYNRGPKEPHICPRILANCKSGEGYDLCTLHDSPGHAEHMTMESARAAGISTEGADAYMYGHWWACEFCWNSMLSGNIRDLYVTDDAHERFSRENVFRQTLVGYPEDVRKRYGII